MEVMFNVNKHWFFVLPSIEVVTSPLMEHIFKFAINIDWLCFHLNIHKENKKEIKQ